MSIIIGSGVFWGLLCLLAIPGMILQFRDSLESKLLTKYGKVAITNPIRREIKVDCGSQGPYGWTDYILHYDFLTEAGETVSGTYTSKEFVDDGISALVIYNPKNPKKHRLYRALQHEPFLMES
ncbi:hypothetical protein [Armatimonas sp.]|uniref:hypothetical protein n=1 Tax=Armatimonas sp. TaxID=1872638 RepID=UPI00374D728E